MLKPVATPADLDGFPMAPEQGSEKFGAKVAPIAEALGLTGLGCMLIEVEPGKRGFPFHNHLGNDEMFVILEGEGTYRFGDQAFPIKAGDVCGAPKGGPETAHQIVNTGSTTLKYLGISTTRDPDICEYPDSGKFAAIGIAPGADFRTAHLKIVARREDGRDYWEGEDL